MNVKKVFRMTKARVLGAQSLRRKLKRMPEEIKKPVQDAISDGMEAVYADALAKVPVEYGDLAGALSKKTSSDKLGARVGFWKKGNKRKWLRGGWYAKFIEFGTRGNNKNNIPAQPARPFLGPAARQNERWFVDRIKRAVNDALKKASNL